MGVKCEIQFDQNPFSTYFSGQVVFGKVNIILDKPKNVRGIAIKICGFAQAHWKELKITGTGKNKRNCPEEHIHFNGREDYMSSTTYVVGSDDGNAVNLNPGIHTYTFSCSLPPSLPSSFEGTHGHIRYLVKVILDRPWKFDQTSSLAFTVLKPLDLNYESPALRMPVQYTDEKQFWCGLCSSSPLTITLSVPQTGYVSGQVIAIEANIQNASNIRIKSTQIGLRKIVIYHSQTPSKQTYEEIIYVCTKKMGEVTRRSSHRLMEYLTIPPVPPTSTFFSKIIHITYELELLAELSGLHRNFRISCPITIGTVPLINEVIEQQPKLTNVTPESMEIVSSTLPVLDPISNRSPSTPNSNISPPSYEEAIHVKRANITEEDLHAIEESHFIPRYPVYRLTDIPSPSAPDISEAGLGSSS